MVWPKARARPVAPEVPEAFAQDFQEAALVLADSPKASAALSRRCLQRLLEEVAKVKAGRLMDEISAVMPTLPSYLADAVDEIRRIGNFAAHPLKSTNSGEILDVEPGEAEWSLETLELLFDHYFVQPKRTAAKKAALDEKRGRGGEPSDRK